MRFAPAFIGASAVLAAQTLPSPPEPEPIEVIELPLPPVIPNTNTSVCTSDINPRRTGCVGQVTGLQSGSFTPDGNHVVAVIQFAGAPSAPDPASIYTGLQLIVIKTDNTTFANGDTWKCITCGASANNTVGRNAAMDYPHAFNDGKHALAGTNVIDCGGALLTSEDCTPDKASIIPIRWNVKADGSGPGGAIRELRMHPDDEHLGWNSFAGTGQFAYTGRLSLNEAPTTGEPLSRRYDLTNVNTLIDSSGNTTILAQGNQLKINNAAIEVGELRGFSGTGEEVTYIGNPWESCNIDVFAVSLQTGAVRRLTAHPDYTDPVDISPDDNWTVALDTRGSERQMFMAGMRAIPPLIDLVAVTAASSTRNNGQRRFFQPWLIDRYGDRGTYFGQQLNAAGDGSPGSINDPNWNAKADPHWSPDGTRVSYWQSLVVPPACGGDNPLPCPVSTAQGGRTERLMLARLTSRTPLEPQTIKPLADVIPWAVPYVAGSATPNRAVPASGNYTLAGEFSGFAQAFIDVSANLSGTVEVTYQDFSDDGAHILNGVEKVTVEKPNFTLNLVDWYSDLTQTGAVNGTKKTIGDDNRFYLSIDVMTNIFNATGNLTTTLDGITYRQPANDT